MSLQRRLWRASTGSPRTRLGVLPAADRLAAASGCITTVLLLDLRPERTTRRLARPHIRSPPLLPHPLFAAFACGLSAAPTPNAPPAQARSRCRQGKPCRKDVVSRSKSWIAVIAITVVATALAAVALPQEARRPPVSRAGCRPPNGPAPLDHRLNAAQAALAAAVAADTSRLTASTPAPTPTALPTPDVTPTPDVAPTLTTPTPDVAPAPVAVARHSPSRSSRRGSRRPGAPCASGSSACTVWPCGIASSCRMADVGTPWASGCRSSGSPRPSTTSAPTASTA